MTCHSAVDPNNSVQKHQGTCEFWKLKYVHQYLKDDDDVDDDDEHLNVNADVFIIMRASTL